MTQPPLPDAVDTRIVFRVYAALAFAAGVCVLAAPEWLNSTLAATPAARQQVFGLFAVVLFAAACFALGFAQIEDPRSRHRALLWFAIGHAVAFIMIATIHVRAEGRVNDNDLAVPVSLAMAATLFYFWQTGDGYRAGQFLSVTRLFDADPGEQLRSRYEQQIREAGAQEERNRLARDLHDSIKQQVFAIQTAAATAQTRFDGDADGAKAALAQVRDSAREAMAEMEALLDNLRAAPLENAGLVEALKKQCEALGFRTGVQVDFRLGELPTSNLLPPGAQQAIFRVAQESLANVARHARARRVRVLLGTSDKRVVLEVTDDGRGFDQGAVEQGMGLRNMRARATEVGGTLSVVSRPDSGTTVRVSVPAASGPADISGYARQLLMWTFNLVIVVGFSLLAWLHDHDYWMTVILIPLAIVAFARSLVAYVRARRERERCSWIASPSR